jgi:hypothetical protein
MGGQAAQIAIRSIIFVVIGAGILLVGPTNTKEQRRERYGYFLWRTV